MPAVTGHADNRIYKAEDFLDILDWDNLAVMPLLHLAGEKPFDYRLYKFGRIGKLLQLLNAFGG
jgi:hypothetical protein